MPHTPMCSVSHYWRVTQLRVQLKLPQDFGLSLQKTSAEEAISTGGLQQEPLVAGSDHVEERRYFPESGKWRPRSIEHGGRSVPRNPCFSCSFTASVVCKQ